MTDDLRSTKGESRARESTKTSFKKQSTYHNYLKVTTLHILNLRPLEIPPLSMDCF
jgi:hypothetical protein